MVAVEGERTPTVDLVGRGVINDEEFEGARTDTLDVDADADAPAPVTAAAPAEAACVSVGVGVDAPTVAALLTVMATSPLVCLIAKAIGLAPPLCQAPPTAVGVAVAAPPAALLKVGGVAMTVVGGAKTVAAALGREAAEATAGTATVGALAVATRAAKLRGAVAGAALAVALL